MTLRSLLFVPAILLPLAVGADQSGGQATTLDARDRTLTAETTEVYSVGGLGAPEWAAFSGVTDLAFDRDGRLLALDGRNHRVVILDPGGELVAEVGRQGGGPGEFQAPRSLAVLADGSWVVLDILARRLSHFGPDGELLVDQPARGRAGQARSIVAGRGPVVVGEASVLLLNGEPVVRTSDGMKPTDDIPILAYALGDEEPRIIHRARLVDEPEDGRGRPFLTAFFPEFRLAGLSGGRIAVVDGADYRITVVSQDGAVERRLLRPLPDRPVTEAHRRNERERLLERLADGTPPEATVSFGESRPSEAEMERRHRRRIEKMRFPDRFAHVQSLRGDAEGRLWVERTGPDPHGAGPIDVIGADGRYLGTLPAGEPGMPRAHGPDGLAAVVETDELDVPTIRVRRIRLDR